jgi:hypothetical protein
MSTMYYPAFGAFVCVVVGLVVSLATRFAFPDRSQVHVSLDLIASPCQRCADRLPEDDLLPEPGYPNETDMASSPGSKTAATVYFVGYRTTDDDSRVEFSTFFEASWDVKLHQSVRRAYVLLWERTFGTSHPPNAWKFRPDVIRGVSRQKHRPTES